MSDEQEAKEFTSEHRTFAEREGYGVIWSHEHKAWIVSSPRKMRPGERPQRFKTLAMAWEVAAIRAGRKIARVEREKPRPAPIRSCTHDLRGTKL